MACPAITPRPPASCCGAIWRVKVRRNWFTVLAVIMVSLISLSRLYLGAHLPQDVLASWLLGESCWCCGCAAKNNWQNALGQPSTGGKLAISVLGPSSCCCCHLDRDGQYPNMFGA